MRKILSNKGYKASLTDSAVSAGMSPLMAKIFNSVVIITKRCVVVCLVVFVVYKFIDAVFLSK